MKQSDLLVLQPSTFVEMPIDRSEGAFATDFSGIVRPRHHHRELEFNLILKGTARFAVGPRLVEVSQGQLLWFLPHQDHILISATSNLQMWIAAFGPSVLADSRLRLPHRWPLLYEQSRSMTAEHFRHLSELCGSFFLRRKSAPNGLSLRLLSAALDELAATVPNGHRPHPAVIETMRILERNVELGRAQLARRVSLAPGVLSRLFVDTLGVTIPDYRNRIRLGRVLSALEKNDSLLRAALAAGFGSYAQFHRVVQLQTGDSPSKLASSAGRRSTLLRCIDFKFD